MLDYFVLFFVAAGRLYDEVLALYYVPSSCRFLFFLVVHYLLRCIVLFDAV